MSDAPREGAPTDRRAIISWALYDWANSAFFCTVMAGFFPVFFKDYWSVGVDPKVTTFRLGAASAIESVAVALLAPVLGAIADRGGTKKRFLALFAGIGIAATAAMFLVGRGQWPWAWALYVIAAGGLAASLIFYDALLVGICREDRVHSVSALGYSLGYLGGGILFAANVLMILDPASFGLRSSEAAVGVSFLTVAAWWAIFSLPLFRYVPEPRIGVRLHLREAASAGLRQVGATFREIRKLRVVFWFLLGYWLYIDGVDTVMRMAVDYGKSIGFETKDLIVALLITQFVGFPAAILFGWIGGRIGAKTGILIGLAVYLGVSVWGAFMRSAGEFYAMAVVVGLVQGGVQALSRSFYARIIPKDKAAEFFGFYNMLGKFAAVVGPLLMGGVGILTGSPRIAIVSISVLFLLGGAILASVDETAGRRAAEELERA